MPLDGNISIQISTLTNTNNRAHILLIKCAQTKPFLCQSNFMKIVSHKVGVNLATLGFGDITGFKTVVSNLSNKCNESMHIFFYTDFKKKVKW